MTRTEGRQGLLRPYSVAHEGNFMVGWQYLCAPRGVAKLENRLGNFYWERAPYSKVFLLCRYCEFDFSFAASGLFAGWLKSNK